ncbi:MAG TPA: porin family protein [Niabella sp.]|nr:porin family protein [Niabella sp.]
MKLKQFMFSGLLMALLSILTVKSQAQVQIGVRAGVNFSNISGEDSDGDKVEDNKLLPGFHAGITFDIPVADEFAVQPGLLFSTKGVHFKENDGDSYKQIPYYVEIPVNFLYKPELGNGRLLLGAGPYVAYGFGGKWKWKYEDETESGKLIFKNDLSDDDWENLKDDEDYYGKPLDFGANLLAGYEFSNKLSLQLNAQLGMANIAPKYNGQKDGTMKNVGFGISLGYKF